MNTQISIKQYIEQPSVKARIEDLLKNRASQFMITITSMVNNNQKLAECEPNSLFTAALTITALDLPMNNNLGFAWIIPYQDGRSGKTFAQIQLGYKGFIQLSLRSNKFKTLNVSDVRQGEYKSLNRLTGEINFEWEDDEEKRSKLPVIGFVAYMKLNNGFEKSYYMTAQEVRSHGEKYSTSFRKYKSGLWVDEFDKMAKKTVIKLMLSKYAPISIDMQRAREVDQAVISNDEIRYIDNEKKEQLPTDSTVAEEPVGNTSYIKKDVS